MFIKSLRITSGSLVIREINFHTGLNLIVDDTPTSNGDSNVMQKTGNNVGKTTVLKLIDICLGANPKNIYSDSESGKESYDLVKEFLEKREVLITLVLKKDLSDEKSTEIVIERNFLKKKQLIRRINGEQYTETEFLEKLRQLIIPTLHEGKPTFRQVISHNIRYSDLSINNTLKTLDRFTKDSEYETLYLFLFGCNVQNGEKKQKLLTRANQEITFKKRLEKKQTKNAYEAALEIINDEIYCLDSKKTKMNINPNYASDLEKLNVVKSKINHVAAIITSYETKKDLIEEAQAELESEYSNIDTEQLKQIYTQATSMIDNVQKTFEQLLEYHNRMIYEKIKFITKELPALNSQIKKEKLTLKELLVEEERLSAIIAKSDSFKEMETLITELNEKYKKKGEYESIIQQIEETERNINSINEELNTIEEQIFSAKYEEIVKGQLAKFNRYFSSVSFDLYGEKYAIKYDIILNKEEKKIYKFTTFNANISSGKKQGEILCFDLAMIMFSDQEKIPCLNFILNDKKELMHGNQLTKLKDYLEDKNIQVIISMLKDKLPQDLTQEKYYVVQLSQDDKLFKIEQYE